MEMRPGSYIMYCRKSTDTEDKQALSIDSQVKELTQLAARLHIRISETICESKSAKQPGRPGFNALLEKINSGKVQGVLSWKLDRLARNPVDGGSMIWAIQRGLQIVTPFQTYSLETNSLMLMYLEFGIAHNFINDLSRNVKRGNKAKLELGGLPGGIAPIGYINDPVTKTVVPDKDRFKIVQKMWKFMLTGNYSVAKIRELSAGEWGLRTVTRRHRGGGEMAASAVYKLFCNPFYYGVIRRKIDGEVLYFKGKHKPMITKTEFDCVQQILRKTSTPREQVHSFAFAGLLKCGNCGCAVTAEQSTNRQGHKYIYYHCTRRKKAIPCREPFIREEQLRIEIVSSVERLSITDEFETWAMSALQELHGTEVDDRSSIQKSLQRAYNAAQKGLDELFDMKLRGLLTDEEFITKKQDLVKKRDEIQEKILDNEHRADMWMQDAEDVFRFALRAKVWLKLGTIEEKKLILRAFGSDLILLDKKLIVKPFPMFKPFLRLLSGSNEKLERFGLEKAHEYSDSGNMKRKNPLWWSIVKQVRQAVYDSSAQDMYLYKFIIEQHRHEFNGK